MDGNSSDQRLQELLDNNRALKSRIRENVDSISTLRSIVESEFENSRSWTPPSASSTRFRGHVDAGDSDKLKNNGPLGYPSLSSISAYSSRSATPRTLDYSDSYRAPPGSDYASTIGGSPSRIDAAIENVQKRSPHRRQSPQKVSSIADVNGFANRTGPTFGTQEVSPVWETPNGFHQPRRVFFPNEHTGDEQTKRRVQDLADPGANNTSTLNALRSVRQSLKSYSPERSHDNDQSLLRTHANTLSRKEKLGYEGQGSKSHVGWTAQKQSVLQRWGGPLMEYDATQSVGSESDEEIGEHPETFAETSSDAGSAVDKDNGQRVDGGTSKSTWGEDADVNRTSERLEVLSSETGTEGSPGTPLVQGWIYKSRLVPGKLHYKYRFCGVFRGARTTDKDRARNCIACYKSKAEMMKDIESFRDGSKLPGRGSKGGFANASTVIDLSKLVVLSKSPPQIAPPEGLDSLETSVQLHHMDVKESKLPSRPWLFVARTDKEKRKWAYWLKQMAANASVKMPRHIRKELIAHLREGPSFRTEREDVMQAFKCYREGDVDNAYRMLLRALSDGGEHEGRRFLCELYLRGIPGRYELGDPESLHKVAELVIEGAQVELFRKQTEAQFCGLVRSLSEDSLDLIHRKEEGSAVDVLFARLILRLMNA